MELDDSGVRCVLPIFVSFTPSAREQLVLVDESLTKERNPDFITILIQKDEAAGAQLTMIVTNTSAMLWFCLVQLVVACLNGLKISLGIFKKLATLTCKHKALEHSK